jgi:hypothetical protein
MKFIKSKKTYKENLVENVNFHKTTIKKLGELKLPEPKYGDLKLSVMPFENNGKYIELPENFKMFEEAFNEVVKQIPLQEGANTHYVTIDTKFFTNDDYLRREGVHIDGNFCVDPNFGKANESTWGGIRYSPDTERSTWGGIKYSPNTEKDEENKINPLEDTKNSIKNNSIELGEDDEKAYENRLVEKKDNSHVDMDWVLPYDIVIPISEYVSSSKGGILTVSTEPGCKAWKGNFKGEILSEGACDNLKDQLTEDREVIFEKNQLYFMTSNTPHETLMIEKGTRRTFLRITLNHNYDNSVFKK